MLLNLVLGLSIMLLCLLLQIMLLLTAMRYYRRREQLLPDTPSFSSSLSAIGSIMLLLVLGNLIQIAIWGILFLYLGEFSNFSEAFYHSAVNFATLGYGDLVMSGKHRLLGPLESVNGILMIGLSTSALMSALQNTMRRTLKPRGDHPDS
ncbi:potassium channel family protein [Thiolapillus sp.]